MEMRPALSLGAFGHLGDVQVCAFASASAIPIARGGYILETSNMYINFVE